MSVRRYSKNLDVTNLRFVAAKLPVTECKSLPTNGKLDITTPHNILNLRNQASEQYVRMCVTPAANRLQILH